jgi:phage terminase large subunit-like protein
MNFKDTADSSYVVGQVWANVGARIYLLDQVRERMDFAKTLTAIESLSQRWPRATPKLVEDKASGPAVISALKYRVSGVVPVKPQGGQAQPGAGHSAVGGRRQPVAAESPGAALD